MKVVHVSQFDAAAAAWNYSQSLKYGGVESRTLMLMSTICAPDSDMTGETSTVMMRDALDSADRIIFHVAVWDFARRDYASRPELIARDITDHAIKGIRLEEYFTPEKAVVWFNGSTALRHKPDAYLKAYADFPRVATTPDLCKMLDAHFAPCCIHRLAESGAFTTDRDWTAEKMLVSHAPTDPRIKNTQDLDLACAMLADRLDWLVVHNKPWRQAMQERQWAHVCFDHMQGYPGVCAYEASAMRQVVLLHLDDNSMQYIGDFCEGDMPPWVDVASGEGLRRELEHYADHRDELEDCARLTREWYDRAWTNRIKGERLAEWLKGL